MKIIKEEFMKRFERKEAQRLLAKIAAMQGHKLNDKEAEDHFELWQRLEDEVCV